MQKLEANGSKKSDQNSDELIKILKAIEIKIPAKIAETDKDIAQNLFSVAYNNRDHLINGVTNAMNASDGETFLFYNIIPKLQAHGLAENQREPGFKFRRGYLNKRGQALFAEVEKKILLAQANAKVQPEKLRADDSSQEVAHRPHDPAEAKGRRPKSKKG